MLELKQIVTGKPGARRFQAQAEESSASIIRVSSRRRTGPTAAVEGAGDSRREGRCGRGWRYERKASASGPAVIAHSRRTGQVLGFAKIQRESVKKGCRGSFRSNKDFGARAGVQD